MTGRDLIESLRGDHLDLEIVLEVGYAGRVMQGPIRKIETGSAGYLILSNEAGGNLHPTKKE